MTTLLRDLIEIPDRVLAGDFVLALSKGVEEKSTIDQYVVTEQLAGCFDRALGVIQTAVETSSSRASYLDGSFGSGKSHFMAILYALLRHDGTARAKAELQQVIAKHDDVLLEKNVLPLAFHLIGAESLEQALFAGYIRQIAHRHPGAPLPALHESDAILRDAERMRARDGDERFFAGLTGGPRAVAGRTPGRG